MKREVGRSHKIYDRSRKFYERWDGLPVGRFASYAASTN
jgi:hypothetical protein